MEQAGMMANNTTAFSQIQSSSTNVLKLKAPMRHYVVQDSDADWRDEVAERLNELVALPVGWDGYAGRPVSFHNAHFALSMLNTICPPDAPAPQIVPGSGGDLQIEWHSHVEDIELHVHAPFRVTAWRAIQCGDEDGVEIELEQVFTTVAEWIEEMMERELALNPAAA